MHSFCIIYIERFYYLQYSIDIPLSTLYMLYSTQQFYRSYFYFCSSPIALCHSKLLPFALFHTFLLYSILRYATLLYSTFCWYSTLLYFVFTIRFPSYLLYSNLPNFTLLHSTPLHSTLLYSTLLYFTLLYFTLLYLLFVLYPSITLLYLEFTLLFSSLLCPTLLYTTLIYSPALSPRQPLLLYSRRVVYSIFNS